MSPFRLLCITTIIEFPMTCATCYITYFLILIVRRFSKKKSPFQIFSQFVQIQSVFIEKDVNKQKNAAEATLFYDNHFGGVFLLQ